MQKYTAVVIGAGPAGHTAAVRLAELGARVAVVERDYIGGICTNWGCTPSKSMIESAKIARLVRESSKYGILAPELSIDFKQVAARRDEIIRQSREYVTRLLKHHGVDIYHGEAGVEEPGRVLVRKGKLDLDGENMSYTGEVEEIQAENIILATGSQPITPNFVLPDNPYVVSSNRLISIGVLPKALTIVGGGVIGIEFATIFSNLGSRVTIVEMMDRLLTGMDPEISAEITRQLEMSGVRVLTSMQVSCADNGMLQAFDRHTGQEMEVHSDSILIAIGRKPVIEKGMFDRLGIGYTDKGILIDDTLQTTVPGIWAIGDATGKSVLAHVGIQQGIICAENIMRPEGAPPRRMDYSVIPAVVYSIPEVYSAGVAPIDLEEVEVYKVPFAANLRARIEDFKEGFVKVWIKEGRVVAAQAIGHNVSEMMQELTNMIALKTPINEVAEIIHAHPTYSEITRTVLEVALNKAVDFIPQEHTLTPG